MNLPSQTPPSFGYCTNVHAGSDLDTAKANLEKYAGQVQRDLGGTLPLGLWLSENAAASLSAEGAAEEFGAWLSEHQFSAYTLNGFPQQDFHADVVKHQVYLPTWADQSRQRYTHDLALVLDRILPAGCLGTISTLPLGWPTPDWNGASLGQAATRLRETAVFLDRMLREAGREIVLCIEPEPGCVLNTSDEIVDFFKEYLLGGQEEAAVRQHIAVCHDICHSGVMFEPQEYALRAYHAAGIRIGKVQVSSAVHVPWNEAQSEDEKLAIAEQLSTFHEPKYLHQTARSSSGRLAELAEDLPIALSEWPEKFRNEPWRVHFHVPIYVDRFDHLQTTQADIVQVTQFLKQSSDAVVGSAPWFTGHYEVETYAWPVLPQSLQIDNLAAGITKELKYFEEVLQQ